MSEPVKASDKHVSKFDAGADYLKSLDLLVDGVFKSVELTIAEFFPARTLKQADGKLIDKPVISFEKTDKRLILNNTNQSVLHLISGTSDGSKIRGTMVKVEARVVKAFGDDCLGLRLIPNAGTLMTRSLKQRLGSPAVWEGKRPDIKEEHQ